MPVLKKFYFSRVQKAAEIADDEESARMKLAEIFGDDVEDFILDDVRPVIEAELGVFKVVG